MVWEQGVVVIVNLTKLSDLGLVSNVLLMAKLKLLLILIITSPKISDSVLSAVLKN